MRAKVISVNVATPTVLPYRGRRIRTGIIKRSVAGRVQLGEFNLEGDKQADLENHGGRHKAVYAYPREQYDYWRGVLQRDDLPCGRLGENLTTEGLADEDVCIGDQLAVGDSLLRVTQPRIPCYKLNASIGRSDFLPAFRRNCRLGFYLQVVKTGSVAAGDDIAVVERHPAQMSVYEITQLYFIDTRNYDAMEKAVALESLPAGIADIFETRLLRAGRRPA